MTKKIGITGGIGSGKSYICNFFQEKFGIIVYNSDIRAKFLMVLEPELRKIIIKNFGNDSYILKDGDFILNKSKFIKLLFEDNEVEN